MWVFQVMVEGDSFNLVRGFNDVTNNQILLWLSHVKCSANAVAHHFDTILDSSLSFLYASFVAPDFVA